MDLEPLYLVRPSGAIVELDAGVNLRDVIGGWIERVVLVPHGPDTYGLDVWADEEGLLRGLEPNPIATILCRMFGAGQVIVGPVVIAGSLPPDVTGCPEGVGVELRRIAGYVANGGDDE